MFWEGFDWKIFLTLLGLLFGMIVFVYTLLLVIAAFQVWKESCREGEDEELERRTEPRKERRIIQVVVRIQHSVAQIPSYLGIAICKRRTHLPSTRLKVEAEIIPYNTKVVQAMSFL